MFLIQEFISILKFFVSSNNIFTIAAASNQTKFHGRNNLVRYSSSTVSAAAAAGFSFSRINVVPCIMNLITTNKATLPPYLLGSAFYNSLSSEENEEFCIPEENLKLTPTVQTIDELSHLLNTLQYWGVTTWPAELVSFLSCVHSVKYQEDVTNVILRFETLRELFPLYTALQNLVTKSKRSFADRQSVRIVIPLLYSENDHVVKLTAVILENIATVCSGNRNCVFEYIDFAQLHRRMRNLSEMSVLQELSILFLKLSGFPTRPLYVVRPILPLLIYLLDLSDETVLTHACKALGFICDNNKDCIEAVLDMGVAPRVLDLATSDSEIIGTAALFLVGALTSKNSAQVQVFLDLDMLRMLIQMCDSAAKHPYICWIVTNIANTTATQVQLIYDSGLLPEIVRMLEVQDEATQTSAARAVSAIIFASSIEQSMQLVAMNLVPPFCKLICTEEDYAQEGRKSLTFLLHTIKLQDAELYERLAAQVTDICGSDIAKRIIQ